MNDYRSILSSNLIEHEGINFKIPWTLDSQVYLIRRE